jgi:hypothetical protein
LASTTRDTVAFSNTGVHAGDSRLIESELFSTALSTLFCVRKSTLEGGAPATPLKPEGAPELAPLFGHENDCKEGGVVFPYQALRGVFIPIPWLS